MQQLDESEYATASDAGSERGRRRHRGYQDERLSAGHEDAGRSLDGRIRIHRSNYHPGGERVCSSPGETKGQTRLHHWSWDSGWRQSRA